MFRQSVPLTWQSLLSASMSSITASAKQKALLLTALDSQNLITLLHGIKKKNSSLKTCETC